MVSVETNRKKNKFHTTIDEVTSSGTGKGHVSAEQRSHVFKHAKPAAVLSFVCHI